MKKFTLFAFALAASFSMTRGADPQSQAPEFTRIAERIVEPAFDPQIDSEVVGFSHHVFVGRVTRNLGLALTGDRDPGSPYTLFEVEVLRAIKGELPAKVVVRMEGAIKDGVYVRVQSDNRLEPDALGLLKVGAAHVFVTMGTDANDLSLLSSSKARVTITKNSNASNSEVLKLARPRIAELIEAYSKEVVPPAPSNSSNERLRQNVKPEQYAKMIQVREAVQAHRAKYDFKSLPAEKQQQLKDEAVRIRAELAAEAAVAPAAVVPKPEPLPSP